VLRNDDIDDLTFTVIKVGGKRKWLVSNGQILPYVSGGDGPEDDDDDDDDQKDDDGKGGAKPPEQKFSQADINRAARAERKAAELKMAKRLGFETVEAMEAAARGKKAADEKDSTDLETAKTKAAENETRAERAERELAEHKLTVKVERALVKAGLTVEGAEKARKLVDLDDPDVDAAEITEAVEALRKEFPSLFPEQDDDEKKPLQRNPPNPGSKPPSKGNNRGDSRATANQLLYERHPELKKS